MEAQELRVFNLDFISLIFICSRPLAKYRTIDRLWLADVTATRSHRIRSRGRRLVTGYNF